MRALLAHCIFPIGKAADLSNLNLKESELQQQQQHQEMERGENER